MFIWSVKLNRNIMWGFCAAVCLALGAVAAFTPKDSVDVLKSTVDTTAKTIEQQTDFLKAYGYEAEKQPLLIEEVIIPSEFDDAYESYNNFQKISGFDLSKFKGYRVKKYTYLVTNYPDAKEDVYANLFIYNSKIIGGDISSSSYDGFVHGFVKE